MTLATVKPNTPAVIFTVDHEGKAVPSGVRPVPLHGHLEGQSRIAEGNDKDHEKRIKAWKLRVATAAHLAYPGTPVEGPVAVEIIDFRKRPANQMGTGRNAGALKDSASKYPTTTPDCGKTARLIEDAMSGVIYKDDSQIVEERLMKLFAAPGAHPRIEVTVWVLDSAPSMAAPGQLEPWGSAKRTTAVGTAQGTRAA